MPARTLKFRVIHILGLLVSALLHNGAAGQQAPIMPMPIEFENSAEFRWLRKEVLDSRVLDDMSDPGTWAFQGTGELSFRADAGPNGMSVLRVDVEMFTDSPAPTRNGLSSVNLKRAFPGENWSEFNRLSMWIRPDVSGFPMLPLQIVLHNEGKVVVPDAYNREGIHYVTLENGGWQHVVWEIAPLPRDRVTSIEIGYWVNKMLADTDDRVAFEIGHLELQRVEPDHYEGWNVAPGRISFSHTGYQAGSPKTAIASDLGAREFQLVRIDDNALGEVVVKRPVQTVRSRLGEFQIMDFSDVRVPGSYVILAGDRSTRPFRIDEKVWRGTIWKAINFFFSERCGFAVPGSHGADHLDWTATHGDLSIVMNGGWHDAGDLSQGLINTGEATYAMFALARQLQVQGDDPGLLERLIEEAEWGLDWMLKVRFDGGYRIGFASHNLWTNGVMGDADDRSREALNNPNVNYIAAAAEALAYRVLKDREPALAARSLQIAREDWGYAIDGVAGPETWSTPAYMATPIELAGIGILASLELYSATNAQRYADKAIELAQTIVDSQQKRYVGREFPLAGFFYTGPDRQRIFHQFHRGNDQAPIVALARLIETFPDHEDWMDWYSVVALYSEYQKKGAQTTMPYGVLPAYVYHESEYLRMPETLDRYDATPEAYREQVLQGLPMGDGYYLRAFPVWFSRRGNYGVLLSQAKALATAARIRGDVGASALARKQAQWIVGRNPFAQSTMYGEGYDWAQQYSVSSGDIVGSLPVGMQSRGVRDEPYWPAQNMYVYKEVWVHPVSRWLWLMEDLVAPWGTVPELPRGGHATESRDGRAAESRVAGRRAAPFRGEVNMLIRTATERENEVVIMLHASGTGEHTFEIRVANLEVDGPSRTATLDPGSDEIIQWRAAVKDADAPWVAVVIANGDVSQRVEAFGSMIAE